MRRICCTSTIELLDLILKQVLRHPVGIDRSHPHFLNKKLNLWYLNTLISHALVSFVGVLTNTGFRQFIVNSLSS
jgi:hypothetical protein